MSVSKSVVMRHDPFTLNFKHPKFRFALATPNFIVWFGDCKFRVLYLSSCHFIQKWSIFRWFKFTLKPPNSMAHGNFFSAIWDTSHWNFLSNLDSRQLMTSPRTLFGQFLATQGCLSNLPKKDAFRKSNFSR